MALKENNKNSDKVRESITGQKIREIRVKKNISVSELAKACNVNENAIRNWELGIRQVSEDNLEKIAQRLEVPIAALRDRHLDTLDDVMHTLFELAEKYSLSPIHLPDDTDCVLMTYNEALSRSINSWNAVIQNGSSEKFDEWKYSIKDETGYNDINSSLAIDSEKKYADNERAIYLAKALRDSLLIFNTQFEMIHYCLRNFSKINQLTAIDRFEKLQRTLELTISQDLSKYG